MKNKINVGLLYILPWILGILLLKIFPFGLSLFLSFTRYDLISSPQFIGIENYVEMFKDELFIKSLLNTIKYVIVTVPLKLAFALFIASILNFKIKEWGFSEQHIIFRQYWEEVWRYLYYGDSCSQITDW